jgi:hypothetical protein
LQKQQEEEKELQLLIQNQKRTQQSLHTPHQHFPSQQLRTQRQYQNFKVQLAKARLDMSILAVAFCFAGYVGVRFLIAALLPVGEMSTYASAFAGGFPPDFGLQVGALIFFGLLGILMLQRINPDIARKLREEYRRTQPNIT